MNIQRIHVEPHAYPSPSHVEVRVGEKQTTGGVSAGKAATTGSTEGSQPSQHNQLLNMLRPIPEVRSGAITEGQEHVSSGEALTEAAARETAEAMFEQLFGPL